MDVTKGPDPIKYNILYRIIRCLDCQEVPLRGDNDCISLMTTMSDINDEIKVKVRLLDKKGFSLEEICKELQYLYGNHLIANRRDRFSRTAFDYWTIHLIYKLYLRSNQSVLENQQMINLFKI